MFNLKRGFIPGDVQRIGVLIFLLYQVCGVVLYSLSARVEATRGRRRTMTATPMTVKAPPAIR
jgi:hypothetical protein